MEQWALQVKTGDVWIIRKLMITKVALMQYLNANRPRYDFRVIPFVADESRAEYYAGEK